MIRKFFSNDTILISKLNITSLYPNTDGYADPSLHLYGKVEKRLSKIYISAIVLFTMLIISACQTTPITNPTDIPFPTMTVGQSLIGDLTTPSVRSGILPSGDDTITLVNRTTPTPDTGRCPFPAEGAELGDFPSTRVDAINALLQFLNDGSSVQRLQEEILSAWDAFGENGYLETVDLTGEGTVEIVLGYIAPGDVGTLLIFGCQEGRYVQLYELNSDGIDPPIVLALADINNSSPAEVVVTRRVCSDPEACELQTQIVAWAFSVGRFLNVLPGTLITLDPPELRDIDNDQVDELVISLDNNGTAATGPLRQGTNIYDWDGQFYVLSIIQLQEPDYRIQVIHEGDRLFSQLRMTDAITAYEAALANDDLRYWFNDGPTNTISYGQYRLILANAYLGSSPGVINTLNAMNDAFPLTEEQTLDDAPVYVHMANLFVDTLSATGDLHESCLVVQEIITAREDALNFINRYGSRSPSYTELDICPF